MAISLPDARQLSDEVLQALRLRALRGVELGLTEAQLADLLGAPARPFAAGGPPTPTGESMPFLRNAPVAPSARDVSFPIRKPATSKTCSIRTTRKTWGPLRPCGVAPRSAT